MIYESKVPGFAGKCKPTWLNRNSFWNRMDGGITGFFKLVRPMLGGTIYIRTGKEFHGIIGIDNIVRSTSRQHRLYIPLHLKCREGAEGK